MRNLLIAAAAALSIAGSNAQAQVPLSAYVDANGFINVQALMCAQLAGTYQEDADMLTTWYSGWYNGLAKKHFIHFGRAKQDEHETIMTCKANPRNTDHRCHRPGVEGRTSQARHPIEDGLSAYRVSRWRILAWAGKHSQLYLRSI